MDKGVWIIEVALYQNTIPQDIVCMCIHYKIIEPHQFCWHYYSVQDPP